MGQELMCKARFGKQSSQGKAMLETDYVLFRGDFRVKVPFSAMKSVKPRDGWLEIKSSERSLALELGAAAEKWAQKILHPPSRLDKLGIKPGTKVTVIQVKDQALLQEIAAVGAQVGPGGSIILYGAGKKSALDRVGKLAKPDCPVWVVYPKGVHAITENDVLAAIRAAALVDVKVVSFSPTHTALKAVIPKDRRNA